MRVRIEREVCTGAGDCARSVADVFWIDDDGLAMVQEGGTRLPEDPTAPGFTEWAAVPASLEEAVAQAAAACPGTCIIVEQSTPEPEPEPEPAPAAEPEPEVAVTPPPRSSIPKRIAFRLRRLFS